MVKRLPYDGCMTRPHPHVRLFVACYPPAQAAQEMMQSLDELNLPRHRRTATEQVHLTIHFIGDTPVRDLPDVIQSVRGSTAGLIAFELTARRLVSLPRRGPSRLIAAEMDDPASLMEIQRRLVHRLAHRARRTAGDRFLPHMTLCRFATPTRIPRIEHDVECEAFTTARIALMRSRLTPNGAEHFEVESFDLRAQ